MNSRLESQPAERYAGVSASVIWKFCYARVNIALQNIHSPKDPSTPGRANAHGRNRQNAFPFAATDGFDRGSGL